MHGFGGDDFEVSVHLSWQERSHITKSISFVPFLLTDHKVDFKREAPMDFIGF